MSMNLFKQFLLWFDELNPTENMNVSNLFIFKGCTRSGSNWLCLCVFSFCVCSQTIQTFLSCVNRDRLARALFQLAICCGSLDAPQDLVAKEKPQKKAEAKKATEEGATQMLPTEGVNFITLLVILFSLLVLAPSKLKAQIFSRWRSFLFSA